MSSRKRVVGIKFASRHLKNKAGNIYWPLIPHRRKEGTKRHLSAPTGFWQIVIFVHPDIASEAGVIVPYRVSEWLARVTMLRKGKDTMWHGKRQGFGNQTRSSPGWMCFPPLPSCMTSGSLTEPLASVSSLQMTMIIAIPISIGLQGVCGGVSRIIFVKHLVGCLAHWKNLINTSHCHRKQHLQSQSWCWPWTRPPAWPPACIWGKRLPSDAPLDEGDSVFSFVRRGSDSP